MPAAQEEAADAVRARVRAAQEKAALHGDGGVASGRSVSSSSRRPGSSSRLSGLAPLTGENAGALVPVAEAGALPLVARHSPQQIAAAFNVPSVPAWLTEQMPPLAQLAAERSADQLVRASTSPRSRAPVPLSQRERSRARSACAAAPVAALRWWRRVKCVSFVRACARVAPRWY